MSPIPPITGNTAKILKSIHWNVRSFVSSCNKGEERIVRFVRGLFYETGTRLMQEYIPCPKIYFPEVSLILEKFSGCPDNVTLISTVSLILESEKWEMGRGLGPHVKFSSCPDNLMFIPTINGMKTQRSNYYPIQIPLNFFKSIVNHIETASPRSPGFHPLIGNTAKEVNELFIQHMHLSKLCFDESRKVG